MSELLNIIDHSNSVFWNGNLLFLAAYIISLTLVFASKREADRAHKIFAIFSILCVLLFCYNPLIYSLFTNVIPDSGEGEYSRIWIVLPVWMVIAFAGTQIVNKNKSHITQKGICIGVVGGIMLMGTSIDAYGYYVDSDSIFKVNHQCVEISDKILDDSCGENTSVLLIVCTQGGDNTVGSDELVYGEGQYTGVIRYYPYYYSQESLQEFFYSDIQPDGTTLTEENINSFLFWLRRRLKFSYIVIPHEESLPEKMTYCGYEYIDSAGDFDIYKAKPRWFVQSYSYAMEDNNKLYVLSDNVGHCVVIGGGSLADRKQMQSILDSFGKHIDAWIITCPTADNLECFNAIMSTEEYSVGEVYIPSIDSSVIFENEQDALCFDECLDLSNEGKFMLHEVEESDEFELYGMKFQVLSDMLNIQTGTANENSMLLRMEAGEESFLFCSYIGFEQGQTALSKYGNTLQSDYVQIASGAGDGLGFEFYNTVNPDIAFCDSIIDDAGMNTYDMLIDSGVTCYCIENGMPNLVIME